MAVINFEVLNDNQTAQTFQADRARYLDSIALNQMKRNPKMRETLISHQPLTASLHFSLQVIEHNHRQRLGITGESY